MFQRSLKLINQTYSLLFTLRSPDLKPHRLYSNQTRLIASQQANWKSVCHSVPTIVARGTRLMKVSRTSISRTRNLMMRCLILSLHQLQIETVLLIVSLLRQKTIFFNPWLARSHRLLKGSYTTRHFSTRSRLLLTDSVRGILNKTSCIETLISSL